MSNHNRNFYLFYYQIKIINLYKNLINLENAKIKILKSKHK